MSWEEKLNNIPFQITTGDGKNYFPLWKTGTKSFAFNVSDFKFIDVPGTLVERKTEESGKFPLVFAFQGDDNIEQVLEFEKSAKDRRVWTVTHPLYGTIKGQPVSIEVNDESHNISVVTVEFWESIDVDYPNSNFSVKDNTREKSQRVQLTAVKSFAAKPIFKSSDISKMKSDNIQIAKAATPVLSKPSLADQYSEYQNKLATALKASDKLQGSASNAISSAQELLDYPSSVDSPIGDRLKMYLQSYQQVKGLIVQGENLFKNIAEKLGFQSKNATCIASLCQAAVTPADGDYVLVSEVETVSTAILTIYADYLGVIDNASVNIYDIEDTWQPDAELQTQLYDLVMYTISNLYNLGFDSQQERVVYTDRDTNLFLLTHRYLGLDASDVNIERFRKINDIKLNELFKIKKGRKIKYYV